MFVVVREIGESDLPSFWFDIASAHPTELEAGRAATLLRFHALVHGCEQRERERYVIHQVRKDGRSPSHGLPGIRTTRADMWVVIRVDDEYYTPISYFESEYAAENTVKILSSLKHPDVYVIRHIETTRISKKTYEKALVSISRM